MTAQRRGGPADPHAAFAKAIGGASFGAPKPAVAAISPLPAPPVPPPPLPAGAIELGREDKGRFLHVDLGRIVDGRLLIQGVSGAGKSWTLRRIVEQTEGLIQRVVIDPEGEFRDLAERFGMLRVEGHLLDRSGVAQLARRIREHRASIVLDLSESDREEQMVAVSEFLPALIEAPREMWSPALIVIDEAHLFAPFGGVTGDTAMRRAAVAAVTDLMGRGRKRGLAGVLATQRLARLAKSVVSECSNFLIGLNTLDLDVRRAADTIGWTAARADSLRTLDPGSFVAIGPAFSFSPMVVKVGEVRSRHVGARPDLAPPPVLEASRAAELLDVDGLAAAAGDPDSPATGAVVRNDTRALRRFIRDPFFPLAGRVYTALVGVAPAAVTLANLAEHLKAGEDAVAGAVALLEESGAADILDVDGARVIRQSPVMVLTKGTPA